MKMLERIAHSLENIERLLADSKDNVDYVYSVVKIRDDDVNFAASMAQLGDNGFTFVQIIHKNMGSYQVLVRKKKEHGS